MMRLQLPAHRRLKAVIPRFPDPISRSGRAEFLMIQPWQDSGLPNRVGNCGILVRRQGLFQDGRSLQRVVLFSYLMPILVRTIGGFKDIVYFNISCRPACSFLTRLYANENLSVN